MSDSIRAHRRALLLAAATAPGLALAMSTAAAAAPEAGVTVIAEILARPEHAEEVRAALAPFAARTQREPGCLRYALYEDAEAPGRFFTFERWADEAALDAHLASPALKAAIPKLAPLMAAPLAIHKLRTLAA